MEARDCNKRAFDTKWMASLQIKPNKTTSCAQDTPDGGNRRPFKPRYRAKRPRPGRMSTHCNTCTKEPYDKCNHETVHTKTTLRHSRPCS
eukprot:1193549-Amphidinium_carterae.1